ncbi:MAG TPA: hypothetical protein VGV89_06215 [Thermoplasmata archaeon]|nr:hypothetical protein [Thermoplasmata archaeon]
MSLSIDDELTLVEVLVILLGIAITWVVFYHSDEAELPGDAKIPDPAQPEDPNRFPEGRTLR